MSDMKPEGRLEPGARSSHEPSTISVRTILVFAIGLTSIVALVQVAVGIAMNWISHDEVAIDERFPRRHAIEVNQFPAPRLQVDPVQELAEMRQRERERLESYGWVDPVAGIAHIPVDRAIDILASRGLPRIPAPELKPGEAAPIGISPLPMNSGAVIPGRVAPPAAEAVQSREKTHKDAP